MFRARLRAMSEENEENTRRAFDAFNRRDLDAFLDLMDPDVVGIPRTLAIEGGTYNGHEGMRRWWTELLAVFDDFKAEVLEVRGSGDAVVSKLRIGGHGSASDIAISETVWHVTRSRDGRCVWWRTCDDEAEALKAAGLSE
jgi:ketosteroid isomerase-like protein